MTNSDNEWLSHLQQFQVQYLLRDERGQKAISSSMPEASPEEIRIVEDRIGHSLLNDYKHFIQRYSDAAFYNVVATGDVCPGTFFGVRRNSMHSLLLHALSDSELRPKHSIPICNNLGGGGEVCLFLSGRDEGMVFTLRVGDDRIWPCGRSFREFIGSFHEAEEGQ